MNISKHKFIIFGTYSANTLGQIRSLGEKGIHPIAVLVHKNTLRIDKSKYISILFNVKNIEEGLELIIDKYSNEEYKPFLFTDRDDVMSLLDTNYNRIINKFFFWNAGAQGALKKYLNKAEQLKLAEECGFIIPKTEVVKVGILPKSLRYPIFTKAIDSLSQWWKGCAYICRNEEELKRVYSLIEEKILVLQEYIEKSDETPIEGISIDGGKDIFIFGKTHNYRMPNDSFGTYRYIELLNDIVLEQKIKRFIKAVNYTGAFEIELIIDNQGNAHFLEANFRIAQQNYGYTKFGANIPYIYAKSILLDKIDREEIKYTTKRPFNIIYEFEDFKLFVINGKITIKQWIKDIRKTDVFLFYNNDDKAPFYYTIIEKIKNIIGI